MRRFLQLQHEIRVRRYNQASWSLNIDVDGADAPGLCLEIQLLLYEHARSLTLQSLSTGMEVKVALSDHDMSSIEMPQKRLFTLSLARHDAEYLASYLLQYLRDSLAPVAHVDIELKAGGNLGSDATLIINARQSAPPMDGEVARRNLLDET